MSYKPNPDKPEQNLLAEMQLSSAIADIGGKLKKKRHEKRIKIFASAVAISAVACLAYHAISGVSSYFNSYSNSNMSETINPDDHESAHAGDPLKSIIHGLNGIAPPAP